MGMYDKIKKLCSDNGITIKQLEENLDFPRSSISKYDTNIPSIAKVTAIADYFNVSLDLLRGDDNRFSDKNIDLDFTMLTNNDVRLVVEKFTSLDKNHQEMFMKYLDLLYKNNKK